MEWSAKKGLLLLLSCALLLSGGALVIRQAKLIVLQGDTFEQPGSASFKLRIIQGQTSDLHGAFSVDSVENFSFQREGKEAFSLLLAHYKDGLNQDRRAVLYPKNKKDEGLMPSPSGLRQSIWENAAEAIRKNTPEDALFLSWWDDGQRIHFLSGREAWIGSPGAQTFESPLWRKFKDKLLPVAAPERERLLSVAHWLTVDYDKSLAEMRGVFGTSRPIYLLVTNDLLLRTSELTSYGGSDLALTVKTFRTNDNLHGDIAQIKQWAADEGDGNYLVQKEGPNYRVWITPKNPEPAAKNTLLIRLLPFVDSLKQLPGHIQLVYQSQWGGYLSIYKLNL